MKKHMFIKAGFPLAAVMLLSVVMVNQAVAEAIVIPSAGSYSTGSGKASGVNESVLERFRTYNGQHTSEDLTALFAPPENSPVRQLPAIALSDGRTAVIIAARIAPTDGRGINFSVEGATIISIKKIKTDEWEIKALPETGTVKMSLLVMNGSETITYPLIVAPQLPPDTDLSLPGFHEFLYQQEGAGQTAGDLNGDGRHDYLDEYIFTANFLAKQGTTGRDKAARQQRALQRTLAVRPEPQKPEYDPSLFSE